jgi:hypothetical protein
MKYFLISLLLLLVPGHISAFTRLDRIDCIITPIYNTKRDRIQGEAVSNNWCGYVALTSLSKPKKKSVTSVSGRWKVPKLKTKKKRAYSSIWVGIDGYRSKTVEQIGTEHDWIGGKQQNYAWFEMFPRGSYKIVGFPVHTGDSITAKVRYKGNNSFKLSIYNHTKKVYTVIPSSYTKAHGTSRLCAEWIVEAPSDRANLLPLANFDKVKFTSCKATINHKTSAIHSKHWKDGEILMATKNQTPKAKPSSLHNNGKDFTVTWKHK